MVVGGGGGGSRGGGITVDGGGGFHSQHDRSLSSESIITVKTRRAVKGSHI